jgi:thiopeptide-type bacteriocin biosynthesis protein
MRTAGTTPLYRHTGVALLRSAVSPLTDAPDRWPDPSDTQACRSWLDQMWSRPDLAGAIRQASSTLAGRVDAIRAGRTADAKQIRRATVATARYLLRATGRPTPFGLFAGVAPVALGRTAQVRWGAAHRPVLRADTQWLADVVDRLESCPELLERLDVAFNNLAIGRGGRLEVPHGPNRVRIRYTSAVCAVQNGAASPVRFSALADKLAESFAGVDRSVVRDMLTELVRHGFLITCLRAPLTTTDPLAHLTDQLARAGAGSLPSVAPLLRDLETVQAEMNRQNHERAGRGQGHARGTLTRRMREISMAGRTPLAVDLLLDCTVHLPDNVAHEIQRAASALLRLSRQPAGLPAWRAYHAAFCDRYGIGTLVPLTEVLDPDAGLGYPAGYPGSILPAPADVPSERDERLLALAWQAIMDGSREIVLSEEAIRALVGDERLDDRYIPPHVELATRIHAASAHALDRGEYTLTVAPARAGGVLTSRFTPTTTGSGLEEVYRALPVITEGALPVQMSFPPAYPHAENICRVPAYLPHVLSLGEHRSTGDEVATIPVGDLAITATSERLHLVSKSRHRVVEPQVFHALALDKQAPPLARFLAHLARAFTAAWTVIDWGLYADCLPYLPRIRYGRTVLAPARWRLSTDDLPRGEPSHHAWRQAFDRWRGRWGCPHTVDLRDDDRTLRLTLDEPVHAAILHAHLMRQGHAILTDVAAEFGWFESHAHEIVLPLVATRSDAPSPLAGSLPMVTNSGHGQLPGEAGATWLYAKIHAHPERHDELIAEHLPALCAAIGADTAYWFVRYRSPHETDHLRLRLRISEPGQYGAYAAAVGGWARRLRREGVAGWLVFDSYLPEVGRYGHGAAMDAAEAVFVADSRAVAAGLRHLPAAVIHPTALAAVSMMDIVSGFLGPDRAMAWLAARPAPAATAVDRAVADQAVRLAQPGALRYRPWPEEVAEAWQARAMALAAYRNHLPAHADIDTVADSLLHMHHNRAIGIDPDGERTCRRLARQAALAWRARQGGTHR